MRNEIQCLLDWLDNVPSDEKAHRILRALAKESLKKADLEEGKRKFTNKEILAVTNELRPESTANKWVNWKKTVLPYWKAKKEQIIEFYRSQGMTTYPELGCYISEKGGRGNESYYWLKAELLPKINTNNEQNSEQEKNKNLSVIYYEKSGNGEITPAWWIKKLFNNGQIRPSSWHIYVLIGWLFILGISTVVLSYLMWLGLTIPKPVTTHELTAFISIFFPYFVWLAFIKP